MSPAPARNSSKIIARLTKVKQRLFPAHEIIILANDGVSHRTVSSRRQIILCAIAAVAGVWTLGASVGYVFSEYKSDRHHAEALQAKLAYGRLINRVEQSQIEFAAITQDMENSHLELADLSRRNEALQDEIETVVTQLEMSETEKSRLADLSGTMTRQLSDLRTHVAGFSSNNMSLQEELKSVNTVVDELAAERDNALSKLARLRKELMHAQGQAAQITAAKGYAVDRFSGYADVAIAEYERVLAMTEIPMERLVQAAAPNTGMGGPFIPLHVDPALHPVATALNDELGALDAQVDRMEQLRNTLKRLPLATPLDNYYVASLFGKRKDPINGRWAQHNGVDLAGPKNTPIYAAAGGTVTMAGTQGRYGRVVKIDHGHGISSVYGHLNKVLVKKGDTVDYRQRVGLMGSTGRSTGTHLHYEVRVDDKPVNPMKFIEAGRYVFKEK